MISRPTLGDIKYNKMSLEEMSLNYERDLMLWEQTNALNNLAQQTSNNNAPIYTPTDFEYVQLNDDSQLDEDVEFEYGSPEYIENDKLTRQIDALNNKINYLEMQVKGFIWFIISIIVCIGIPAFIITNLVTLRVFIGITAGLLPIAYILVNNQISHLIKRVYALKETRAKLVFNYTKQHTTKETAPKKEILNLQH